MPDDLTGRPNVTGRTSGVEAFWWTIAEFCSQVLLPYVFADAADEQRGVLEHRRLQVAVAGTTRGAGEGLAGLLEQGAARRYVL